ncbi:MAG: hypothetical protein E2603_04525 [Achromobacter sp.]|nr:hypothetical protein [Achromobacter sp.]
MAKRDHRKGALPFRFVPIPIEVLESAEYRALPDPARSLLIDLLMQHTGKNNGRLTTSFIVMKRYGWSSADKLDRAKRALLECPFVIRTRKGCPPRTAEWIGVTWFQLSYDKSMDAGVLPWPYLNFMTLQSGSVDPNGERQKQLLSPARRIDENPVPRDINPLDGFIAAPEAG